MGEIVVITTPVLGQAFALIAWLAACLLVLVYIIGRETGRL